MGVNKRLYGLGKSGRGDGTGAIVAVRNRTFLDRDAVKSALEYKHRRVMAKLGGYCRTTMQMLMRRRDRKSKPDVEAPTSWRREKGGNGALRALIEFGYDAKDQTLVVGPQLITSPTKALGGKTVPQLLDQGGTAVIRQFGGSRVIAHFAPRPFTEKAFNKGYEKLGKLLETVPLIRKKGR